MINSDRELSQLLLAYGPQPSFDDMAWYGLAYSRYGETLRLYDNILIVTQNITRLFEVTKAQKFLKIARDIFDWVWKEGWDTKTCGGGVWFDNNVNGKVDQYSFYDVITLIIRRL